jgi:hypothetical protein
VATLYGKDGKPVDVPDDQVQEAILSGQFGVPEGTKISVRAPDGSVGSIPIEDAHSAFGSGFRFYGDADRAADEEKAKYEGVLPSIEAGAAGLARGGTFGLSDLALTGTGAAKPETLEKLKEHNPGLSTTSEVTGAILPIVAAHVLAPEAALPADAAALAGGGAVAADAGLGALDVARAASELAPTSMVARVGDAAASAVGGGLPGTLARGGVEGAAYGAGQQLSDDVLGDRQLSAENLLAAAGIGAGGGALISGALHIGSAGMKRAAGEIAERIGSTDLAKQAEQSAEELAVKSTGASVADMKGMTRNGKTVNTVGRDLLNEGVADPRLSAEEQLAKTVEVRARVGKEIGDSLATFDAHAAADPEAAKALFSPAKLAQKIEAEVIDKLPYGGAFGDIKAKIEKNITGPLYEIGAKDPFAQMSLTEANALKTHWNDLFNNWNTESTAAGSAVKDATRILKTSIDDAAKSISEKTGTGDVFQQFKDAKRIFGSMAAAEPALQRKVSRQLANRTFGLTGNMALLGGVLSGNPIGVATGVASALVDKFARERGAALAAQALDRLSQTEMLASLSKGISKRIASATTDFGAAKYTVPSAATILDSLHFGHEKAYAEGPRDATEAFLRRADELRSLERNPVKAAWLSETHVAGLRSIAPEHAEALKSQHQAALAFLVSKLPPQESATGLMRGPKMIPAHADVQTFAEYVHAVDKPLEALDAALAGKSSPEAAEAVATVYPRLFATMKAQTLRALQSAEKPPKYQQVVSLSNFFGEPLDATMDPAFIASLQKITPPTNENAGKPRAIPGGGMKSLEDGQTQSQRNEAR